MALIPSVPGLIVRQVESTAELLAARRLHAECYLAAGYVTEDEVGKHGMIDDPWVDFSEYFVAVDSESDDIVGTCRMILPSVRGFPSFQRFDPTPEALEVFRSLDPKLCVEISALATPRQGLQNMAISAALYGLVWRESVRGDRAYMLAIMDDRLLRIMRRWFQFPFEPIGEPHDYMGARTTPVAMYVPRTIEHLQEQNPDALAYFSGDIEFAELDDIALDLRAKVPEHRTNVIDLTAERIGLP